MSLPIHPFLKSYHQISLGCGSPHHFCDAMTFYKLKELNCPSCATPFTTAKIWQEALQKVQECLRVAVKIDLQLFVVRKQVIEIGESAPGELKNAVDDLEKIVGTERIDNIIDRVKHYLDSFPFRDVPGLEFLARQSYNVENRTKYGYEVPGIGSIQVFEELISENNFKKEDVRIIDYGTGSALWSRFFLGNGFDVLSVDCKRTRPMYISFEESFLKDLGKEIHYVKERECGLPNDCSQQILFLCWPENPVETNYPMYAGRVLREFRERNGILAVYVGKERGGITAGPAFFDEMEANWAFTIVDKSKKVTSLGSDMYLLKKK